MKNKIDISVKKEKKKQKQEIGACTRACSQSKKNDLVVGKRTTEAALRVMVLTGYQNRNKNDILVAINFQSTKVKREKNNREKNSMLGFVDFEYVY